MKYQKSIQIVPILVEQATTALAATRSSRTVNLKEKLPPFLRQGVAHVLGFLTETVLTPTFTTAPTSIGLANSVKSLQLTGEGGRLIAQGMTGPDLRALEMYENAGKIVSPEGDTNGGTGTGFYGQRQLDLGPGGFAGNPSDFLMPTALLENAALQIEVPQFTDISADTTAGTVIQRTYALCVSLGSLRIPPKVELRSYNVAGNSFELGERALYTSILYLNSASHDAITAGDFGNFTLADRYGGVFAGIHATVLGRLFHAQNSVGQLTFFQGEPAAATDDNAKVVNSGTPTALVSPTAAYQPVLWSPPASRINKVEVEGPIKLTHDGSQATAYALVRRILPRGEQEASDLATVAINKLGLKFTGGKVKTLSKQPFRNPKRIEYMPWDFTFAR